MNAKAVLTFTFLVLFGNYAVIGESFVELAKHNYKITPVLVVWWVLWWCWWVGGVVIDFSL